MSGDGSWPLQTALFDVMSNDVDVQAFLGDPARIYDDVPQDTPFPYVTFGEALTSDWSTATEQGSEHKFTVHIWSRYGGRKEVKQIMSVLYDLLHDNSLSLTGHRLVNLRFLFSESLRDQDGETYHGVMRFRAVTEPI